MLQPQPPFDEETPIASMSVAGAGTLLLAVGKNGVVLQRAN
jgi:hypothetical protein